jgi:CheY-like chemotaxis protein
MDPETLKRATEPFFSTKGPGKGTGLGLSMVHGLVMQLNGALRLYSQLGQGTRAELWLPVSATAPAVMAAFSEKQEARSAPKATILVVDDDALISMSTAEMLQDLGHEVIEASSGDSALDILREGRPVDLLLSDYSLPRMNGAQVARAARALRPGLPILMATGYAELPPGSDLDWPRLGKPYQQEQLAMEISKALHQAAS